MIMSSEQHSWIISWNHSGSSSPQPALSSPSGGSQNLGLCVASNTALVERGGVTDSTSLSIPQRNILEHWLKDLS